jgi:hypothetical protein
VAEREGGVQVLSLLSEVLGLLFPPAPRRAMSWLSLLTIDMHRLFQLECYGYGYFSRWLVAIAAPPMLATLVIGSRAAWRCLHNIEPAAVRGEMAASGFFAMMLFYPKLSALAFQILRCRSLGDGLVVLEADYTVECAGALYARYHLGGILLVILIPFGVPALLLALLLRASRRHRVQFELMGITPSGGHPLRATLGGASTRTAAEHVYAKLYGTFRFCIDDFRDGCHWFEPVDLLRKLALTALLQFVHRGTAAQVLCGCSVAVASLAMQLTLLPYREPEANVLKAMVDAQIFVTFLISFILRVLNSDDGEFDLYEPVGAPFYGWLLLGSMGLVVATGIGLTARQWYTKLRFRDRMRDDGLAAMSSIGNLQENEDNVSSLEMRPPLEVQRLTTALEPQSFSVGS